MATTSPLLAVFASLGLLAPGALAQQPVQPIQKIGSCPLGYYTSGSYCVPSKGNSSRGAIEKNGNCPIGFYTSGGYCVSSPASNRQIIQKTGNSCPLGWMTSGNYCAKNH